MILQTVELLPSQKAAIEEKVGGKERIVCCAAVRRRSPGRGRVRLRRNRCAISLFLLDRSQHRMSIEDYADLLLQKAGSALTG